jgi:hypothetical protein
MFRPEPKGEREDDEGDRPLLLPGEDKHAQSLAQLHAV